MASNPWFRMYAEWAVDPKVQMLSEADQRRYAMVLCLRCSEGDKVLQDEQVAFSLRISVEEWARTKGILRSKDLITENNQPSKWAKRQYLSDASGERVSKFRSKKKSGNAPVTPKKRAGNGDVTAVKRPCNGGVTAVKRPQMTDTDTDTDPEPTTGVVGGEPPPPPDEPGRSRPIPNNWWPDAATLGLLAQHNIPENFIADLVPEFVLYWLERGAVAFTWGNKFYKHVLARWREFEANGDGEPPRRMPANWAPSQEVWDALEAAGVDRLFIEALLTEFAIFWHDSNQIHPSWNAKFLRHVQNQWANRTEPDFRSTRDIPLREQLTDRSWAAQVVPT